MCEDRASQLGDKAKLLRFKGTGTGMSPHMGFWEADSVYMPVYHLQKKNGRACMPPFPMPPLDTKFS